MTHIPPLRWGSLVVGMATTLATIVLLGTFGSGYMPFASVELGFFALIMFACLSAWFLAAFIHTNWRRLLPVFPQVIRFGVVGLGNTLVDLAFLNLALFALGGTERHPFIFPLAATLSFIVATLNSFYWNHVWTFRAHGNQTRMVLPRFYAVTVTGFLINVGLSTFLVWWAPLVFIAPTLWANIAKVIAAGVSMIVNFAGYKGIVFRQR